MLSPDSAATTPTGARRAALSHQASAAPSAPSAQPAAKRISDLAAYRARIMGAAANVARPLPAAAPRAVAELAHIAPAVRQVRDWALERVLERMDIQRASMLARPELMRETMALVESVLGETHATLNRQEQEQLVTLMVDEMIGLGPLEPLLQDPTVTDIMVNGAYRVFVERHGRIELTDVVFRNDAHVLNVAQRIAIAVARRIDETNPMVDARLADGSRVNIIIPPLSLSGPSISIRKFQRAIVNLDQMVENGTMSAAMAQLLKIAARCRLNVLISGGTGSGKTTLLNAMSAMIDPAERIVTIEDAAELQLQQEHVIRLETRPPTIEGKGEVTARDLLKNALRMRPDRIILGEVRGAEVVDMLQAMNTGHDGSFGTLHANRPREALSRLEHMVAIAGLNLPATAVRTQIAHALDLVVHVARMRDGVRRVTSITEVVGMEGDVVTLQELFRFEIEGEDAGDAVRGRFRSCGLRPQFQARARHFGLERLLAETI